jgi:hypothetical protein
MPTDLTSILDLGLALLAGHFVGDFVLQTNHMVKHKREAGVLLGHCLVVALVSYVAAGRWTAWQIPFVIFVGHAAIDALKVRFGRANATTFVLDQLAHLALIAAFACCGADLGGASQWQQAWGPALGRTWILVCGAVLSVRTGGILIGYWVQPYLDEIQRAGPAVSDEIGLRRPRGLTNGGRVIGQWERALIFIFIVLGQFGAIGFLIAAKSIFRFGELKDRENRMEAEYITIGTLMSFGWALVTACGTWALVRSL